MLGHGLGQRERNVFMREEPVRVGISFLHSCYPPTLAQAVCTRSCLHPRARLSWVIMGKQLNFSESWLWSPSIFWKPILYMAKEFPVMICLLKVEDRFFLPRLLGGQATGMYSRLIQLDATDFDSEGSYIRKRILHRMAETQVLGGHGNGGSQSRNLFSLCELQCLVVVQSRCSVGNSPGVKLKYCSWLYSLQAQFPIPLRDYVSYLCL